MAQPVHLFRHFCNRLYHLATIHSVTDRRTDRQHYHAISLLYCMRYDQLQAVHTLKLWDLWTEWKANSRQAVWTWQMDSKSSKLQLRY